MAGLWQRDKLQPSLLDRLTDDGIVIKNELGSKQIGTKQTGTMQAGANEQTEGKTVVDHSSAKPPQKTASAARLTVNARNLREFIKRDLAALLNTGNLEDVVDLDDYPNVAQSVLNYGIPDLAGMLVSNTDVYSLQKKVQSIITIYEPRILAKSLKVKIYKTDAMSKTALRFVIECDIWGQPSPEHLYLNSELDLETGMFKLSDRYAEM